MVKKDMRQKKSEFSKTLLIQESVLIWITTICFIVLAFYCVVKQYFGELPWLTAMAAFPWSAYGVSQVFYYKKPHQKIQRMVLNLKVLYEVSIMLMLIQPILTKMFQPMI